MIDAEALTKALSGRWNGSRGLARCPAHDDASPSLSIADADDGGLLLHCFAGCTFTDIVRALEGRGLLPARDGGSRRDASQRRSQRPRRACSPPPPPPDPKALRDADLIAEMQANSSPCAGSLAEAYLVRWRGVGLPENEALRFHPRAPVSADGSRRGPGMAAFVIRGALPANVEPALADVVGMQVTPLRPDGSAVKVSRGGKRRTLRLNFGTVKGGAVRLSHLLLDPRETLAVGEGVETCLGFTALTDYPTWATLGASGLAAFVPPSLATCLVIAADHDDAGRKAVSALMARLAGELDHVEPLWPRDPKDDWADVAMGARHVA